MMILNYIFWGGSLVILVIVIYNRFSKDEKFNKRDLKSFLVQNLPEYAVPHRIKIGTVEYNHRFKKS